MGPLEITQEPFVLLYPKPMAGTMIEPVHTLKVGKKAIAHTWKGSSYKEEKSPPNGKEQHT